MSTFPWTFLEDDADLLADVMLFYPRASPLSAPPLPPPPPPPGRFGCGVSHDDGCDAFRELSTSLATVLLTAGQNRPPNLPLVTIGSALLFSLVCVSIFFACRHHKRKIDFLAYKPGPQLSHVVLGPSVRRRSEGSSPGALLTSSNDQQSDYGLPDMYSGGSYGATLPLQKAPLTPALVLLEAPRQGRKEHFNPIYEELDQRNTEYESVEQSSPTVSRNFVSGDEAVFTPVAELRLNRGYQVVSACSKANENLYASIEDQRFC